MSVPKGKTSYKAHCFLENSRQRYEAVDILLIVSCKKITILFDTMWLFSTNESKYSCAVNTAGVSVYLVQIFVEYYLFKCIMNQKTTTTTKEEFKRLSSKCFTIKFTSVEMNGMILCSESNNKTNAKTIFFMEKVDGCCSF